MTAAAVAAAAPPRAPPLGRRLACMVYESLLLFGICLVPGAIGAVFVAQTGKSSPLQSDVVLEAFTFLLFGIYFVASWSGRGQTLAMLTWRIRLERADGRSLGQPLAALRYVVAAAAWFGSAAIVSHGLGLRPWPALGAFAIGVLAWAFASRLAPDRQFWHDRWLGTRLVDARGEPAKPGR